MAGGGNAKAGRPIEVLHARAYPMALPAHKTRSLPFAPERGRSIAARRTRPAGRREIAAEN